MGQLDEKVALVTGGSTGIGLAIARRFAAEGATVYLTGRRKAELDADIGRTALGILKRGDEFIGTTVGIAGEHLTGEEFAAAFGESYGEPVAYRPLTFGEFRALDFPAAAEFGNMFQYYYLAEAEFTASRDPALCRALNPRLQTFRSWLRTHPVPAQ